MEMWFNGKRLDGEEWPLVHVTDFFGEPLPARVWVTSNDRTWLAENGIVAD